MTWKHIGGVEVHLHDPDPFSRIHWIGGWVDPTANLDMVERRKNPRPYQELNPGHQDTYWCPFKSREYVASRVFFMHCMNCFKINKIGKSQSYEKMPWCDMRTIKEIQLKYASTKCWVWLIINGQRIRWPMAPSPPHLETANSFWYVMSHNSYLLI
jgi:hypothetical protein